MHMSDALITPIVGGAMMLTSVGVINHSVKKLENSIMNKRLPYMGVVSAFVFAAQMVNFAIPGTGSSGHIGGGMLLAILLGSHAGFISMATILMIQALFFADGGLLAFGCNLINLGFFTCYVAYPLIYRPMAKKGKRFMIIGTILATVVGLQLGAFSVVLETVISGRSALPFTTFAAVMQPIHLVIGLIEGFITAAIVGYLFNHREALMFDFFSQNEFNKDESQSVMRPIIVGLIVITLVVGGFLSQFASQNPDGLEWSIETAMTNNLNDVSGKSNESKDELELSQIQEEIAVMPDYDFKNESSKEYSNAGTSISGIVGSGFVLGAIFIIGIVIRFLKRKSVKG